MQVELEPERQAVEVTPIECDYLDGENVAWTKRYIADCLTRLEAAASDDPSYAQYLRLEVATYEELLVRFGKA